MLTFCRWDKIDASKAWQIAAYDGLAVAYGVLALVALVRCTLVVDTVLLIFLVPFNAFFIY